MLAAGVAALTQARAQAGGEAAWHGVLPVFTLVSEWPTGEPGPTEYWLTSLPATT